MESLSIGTSPGRSFDRRELCAVAAKMPIGGLANAGELIGEL
jgi:hypothetical protein